MSGTGAGNEAYPPPGSVPPPPPGYQPPPPAPGAAGAPGWAPSPQQWSSQGPQQPAPWTPARGMLGAAHKPGAMPLRPLGLGDIYDAAFRIIRFNPKATVGSAVLVAAVAMAVPVLVTAVLTWTVNLSFDQSGSEISTGELVGIIGSLGSLGIGTVLQGIGTILVTGMIAHVTAAAALGRRLSLGEAWAATHGKRWRLIGLAATLALLLLVAFTVYVGLWVLVALADSTAALVVWGLVSVPLFVSFMFWFWIRVYYLPVPALMLEQVGVLGAVARGFRLTRRQFWRTFGIALLTTIIAGIAGQMLALPVGIIGQVAVLGLGSEYALLGLVLTQALSSVLSSAFVSPFTAAVTSLQYVDQRMRKEAYDVVLMEQAGITAS